MFDIVQSALLAGLPLLILAAGLLIIWNVTAHLFLKGAVMQPLTARNWFRAHYGHTLCECGTQAAFQVYGKGYFCAECFAYLYGEWTEIWDAK